MTIYRYASALCGRIWLVTVAACVGLLLVSCGGEQESSKQASPRHPAVTVRSELLSMMYAEQEAREVLDSVVAESGWYSPAGEAVVAESDRIDSVNQARLEEIVAEYGWPGKSLVGEEAALGAFLILQQADLDLQQKYLPLLQAAVDSGETERIHLAMLQDRILMRQDREQYYGTQLWNDPFTGELGLYPIRDSANVDARRDSVGLGPIGEYLETMGLSAESTAP